MKFLTIITAALLLWGCSKEAEKKVEKVEPKVSLPVDLFSSKNIDGAVSVLEARKLKAGDKVTVHGKIMGNSQPFIDSRASFIIGDPSTLISCDLKPDDPCDEPWDVCCEDNEDIAAGTLNVQVVDNESKILKTGLEGKNGLKRLSKVIIQGVVASNSNKDAMTINAEKIFIQN